MKPSGRNCGSGLLVRINLPPRRQTPVLTGALRNKTLPEQLSTRAIGQSSVGQRKRYNQTIMVSSLRCISVMGLGCRRGKSRVAVLCTCPGNRFTAVWWPGQRHRRPDKVGRHQVIIIGHSGGVWLMTSIITSLILPQIFATSSSVMPNRPAANQQAAARPIQLQITAKPA